MKLEMNSNKHKIEVGDLVLYTDTYDKQEYTCLIVCTEDEYPYTLINIETLREVISYNKLDCINAKILVKGNKIKLVEE